MWYQRLPRIILTSCTLPLEGSDIPTFRALMRLFFYNVRPILAAIHFAAIKNSYGSQRNWTCQVRVNCHDCMVGHSYQDKLYCDSNWLSLHTTLCSPSQLYVIYFYALNGIKQQHGNKHYMNNVRQMCEAAIIFLNINHTKKTCPMQHLLAYCEQNLWRQFSWNMESIPDCQQWLPENRMEIQRNRSFQESYNDPKSKFMYSC